MKLHLLRACLFFLLISSSAYAVDYADQQENLRMMDRLERLERDMGLLQRQVYSGGGNSAPVADKPAASVQTGGNLAQLEARLDEIEEQMRTLNGKLEQAEFNNSKLSEKLDKMAADNEYRFSVLEKQAGNSPASNADGEEKQSSEQEAPAAADKTQAEEEQPADAKDSNSHVLGTLPAKQEEQADAATSKDKDNGNIAKEEATKEKEDTPQEQYNRAFALLRAGKYNEAETAFTQFIKVNSKSTLAGSAYYWLGETYYVQAAYDKAALQFLRSYKNFPQGKKAPESLLKLSMSLGKLKKRKEACATLGKLHDEYPTLTNALKQKAGEVGAQLGCK